MYKVTVAEFRGYKRLIVQNVAKAHFFYVFDVDFHPIFQHNLSHRCASNCRHSAAASKSPCCRLCLPVRDWEQAVCFRQRFLASFPIFWG